VKRRGGIGVINIKTTARNGKVVTIQEVKDNDQMMIITKNGIVIRCPISGISVIGRNTQGVRLINLEDDDKVVDVAHLAMEEEADA
jgi:DNA gyrase subunit A